MQLLQKILRHHVGIPAEASQTQYMQAKTSSLRWVKFGSSLCISGSGKEPNTIWTPPLLHDDKNDAERWGGNSTEVYHFVCKPVVSLSCGIAWALVPRARRLESTGWPAGGQCPGPNLFRSKFIPGLREGVGHTSPSYNKVCPRLPVWKGWPKRARRVV